MERVFSGYQYLTALANDVAAGREKMDHPAQNKRPLAVFTFRPLGALYLGDILSNDAQFEDSTEDATTTIEDSSSAEPTPHTAGNVTAAASSNQNSDKDKQVAFGDDEDDPIYEIPVSMLEVLRD